MKINIGDCIIYNRGNIYQEFRLNAYTKRKEYKMRRVQVTPKYKELVWLKYPSKGLKKGQVEVRYLDFEEGCKDIHTQIKKLDTKKSIYFVTVSSKEQYDDVKRANSVKMAVKTAPPVRTYSDKMDSINNILYRWGIKCENNKIQNQLVKLMIRHEDSWEDVLFTYEMLNGVDFGKEELEDIYPDESFYKLDDFIYNILMGLQPQKTIQMAHYFLEEKDYSALWLLNIIKEKVVLLSYGYQFYRRGVLKNTINPKDLAKRIEFLEIDYTDIVEWEDYLGYYEQKKVIEYVTEIDYTDFQQVTINVFKDMDNPKKYDIYRLIKDNYALFNQR